nr:DEAD/DEAH box helicase [Gemmatimonadales bacterium]
MAETVESGASESDTSEARPARVRTALELDLRRARAAQRKVEREAESVRAAATAARRKRPPRALRCKGEPLDCARRWFRLHRWEPFEFQQEVWQAYLNGESGLIHAATGTGKTYAAWLGVVIEWLRDYPAPRTRTAVRPAAPALRALWITPLRALAADTEAAIRAPVEDFGLPWSIESRTGDTAARTRARQRARLPTALVTTPESLSLLLARDDAPSLFDDLELVVVDEWHELMASKRGAQTELCLARLRRFRPGLRTWGLSATLGNLDVARDTLLGVDRTGAARPGRIIRGLVPKALAVDALIPESIERFPWAGQIGLRLLPEVVSAIEEGETALVFTNTRSTAEIWYQALLAMKPDWAGLMALHHGSLDRKTREWVEDALRDGRLRCVVCTSTLDLGVDFT